MVALAPNSPNDGRERRTSPKTRTTANATTQANHATPMPMQPKPSQRRRQIATAPTTRARTLATNAPTTNLMSRMALPRWLAQTAGEQQQTDNDKDQGPPTREKRPKMWQQAEIGQQEENAKQDEDERREDGLPEHTYLTGCVCGLTFELRGRSREGAWPVQRMMTLAGARAKRLAGGGPWLERRVRPHLRLEACRRAWSHRRCAAPER